MTFADKSKPRIDRECLMRRKNERERKHRESPNHCPRSFRFGTARRSERSAAAYDGHAGRAGRGLDGAHRRRRRDRRSGRSRAAHASRSPGRSDTSRARESWTGWAPARILTQVPAAACGTPSQGPIDARPVQPAGWSARARAPGRPLNPRRCVHDCTLREQAHEHRERCERQLNAAVYRIRRIC
jgi:hypothetical protein